VEGTTGDIPPLPAERSFLGRIKLWTLDMRWIGQDLPINGANAEGNHHIPSTAEHENS
jgi:hypothetical protein